MLRPLGVRRHHHGPGRGSRHPGGHRQLRGCQPGPRGRHRQDRRGAAHQADDPGPDGERGGGADRQRFSEINGPRERGRRRPLFLFPPECGTIPEKSFVKGGAGREDHLC